MATMMQVIYNVGICELASILCVGRIGVRDKARLQLRSDQTCDAGLE